ncbi:hypothetical protein F2Q70_00020947, partial [Brassica cretica]
MVKSTSKDAQDLFRSLHSAYSATPTNLKIIDMYVVFAVFTALIQVAYMALVGSFPFNSFLSGVLSCVGTAVLAVCLRIQVNKENKEFKSHPPLGSYLEYSYRIWHQNEHLQILYSATWSSTWSSSTSSD